MATQSHRIWALGHPLHAQDQKGRLEPNLRALGALRNLGQVWPILTLPKLRFSKKCHGTILGFPWVFWMGYDRILYRRSAIRGIRGLQCPWWPIGFALRDNIYGGFLKYRYPQSSSICNVMGIFPNKNHPAFWGYPHFPYQTLADHPPSQDGSTYHRQATQPAYHDLPPADVALWLQNQSFDKEDSRTAIQCHTSTSWLSNGFQKSVSVMKRIIAYQRSVLWTFVVVVRFCRRNATKETSNKLGGAGLVPERTGKIHPISLQVHHSLSCSCPLPLAPLLPWSI